MSQNHSSDAIDRPVRVRFAPSPTGYLHIGGARTALFNWLFARHHRGAFVLRIEDTDRARSTPEAVGAIFEGLRYLGLDWDEGPEVGGDHGPYLQSERADRHAARVDELLERGVAYPCFCSRERLTELREGQLARKERVMYDRRCLGLDPAEARARLAAGEEAVVRFRVPEGATVVTDLIRGDVTVDHREVDDLVLRRADGSCVYNLAAACDDHDMGITHVIRGEDHLTNTFKQVLLLRALDLEPPEYAHMSLTLAPGGGKLSKRHGAVSVMEYQEAGYLPEAMVNFLVRLGWSYDDKQEIFSRDELVEKFSLDGVTKAGAVYDVKRLSHLGAHWMRERPAPDVLEMMVPRLVAAGFVTEEEAGEGGSQRDRVRRMVELEQSRCDRLAEITEKVRFYFEDPAEPDAGARKALRKKRDHAEAVEAYAAALEEEFPDGWGPLDDARLEAHAERFVEARSMRLGDLAQPVRALVSGRAATPGLFEVLALVGRDASLRRLRRAGEWFAAAAT